MIFYKHFIGDYQRDTGHLSILEHGAYRLLMDACYATEKPLPADERRIFRLLRATEPDEHEAIRTVLAEFWELGTDGWTNKRATEEIAAQRERSEKARESARIRHGKGRNDAIADATAPPNACANASKAQQERRCERSASQSQTPEPEQKKESDSIGEADFEAWWEHVPRKVAKGQARKAYRAALRKTDADTLLAGIKRYAEAVKGKDAQYIRHPATWLSGEGWLDEPEPVPQGKRAWWQDAPLPAHARRPTA